MRTDSGLIVDDLRFPIPIQIVDGPANASDITRVLEDPIANFQGVKPGACSTSTNVEIELCKRPKVFTIAGNNQFLRRHRRRPRFSSCYRHGLIWAFWKRIHPALGVVSDDGGDCVITSAVCAVILNHDDMLQRDIEVRKPLASEQATATQQAISLLANSVQDLRCLRGDCG